MKPAPFAYHDPRTLDEAVGLVGKLENAKLLAGGQSLMPMLNMRYVLPDHVIDLNRVPGLDGIRPGEGGLRIGAMTRQRTMERDAQIKQRAPILLEALRHVGHIATRTRGTFGGSLCHLDPAAELPALMSLCDGELEVASARGRRRVQARDWFAGYMTSALAADEMLLEATLPVWSEPHGHAFLEFSRRHGDFAIAGVGALLALDSARAIRRAAIVVFGTGVAPVRLAEAERSLVGARAEAKAFTAAGETARKLEAIDDAQISGKYRRQLAATLVRRALALAAERADGGSHARH